VLRALVLTLALIVDLSRVAVAGEVCPDTHDGLPLAAADATEPVWYGRAADQVFTASGRSITSITVWKSPTTGTLLTRAGLYVCEAETLDSGEVRSLARRGGILRVGPVIEINAAHAAPIPLVFTLDPPLLLPHGGQFAFAIHDELDCFGIFALVSAAGNPYTGGNLWTTGPYGCLYGPYPGYPLSPADLVFDVAYCDRVAAVPNTWGSLKAAYR
jgi:hypothetical protein